MEHMYLKVFLGLTGGTGSIHCEGCEMEPPGLYEQVGNPCSKCGGMMMHNVSRGTILEEDEEDGEPKA